jgi:hypothetical protein
LLFQVTVEQNEIYLEEASYRIAFYDSLFENILPCCHNINQQQRKLIFVLKHIIHTLCQKKSNAESNKNS